MIVDDQLTFRQAARRLLEARGYDVVAEADCAACALAAVERHEPQAVLLDVRLGDEDGFDVCGVLTRARPELAVLLASDTAYDHSEESIARCGASGFVRKSRLPQTDLAQFWPPL
jgi:DNA-binding NarL/FixJ family response regulator